MHERKRNVLIILLDALRFDRVFGPDSRTIAQRLRDRADASLCYANAYSTASWTLPSHGSLFTGALPSNHNAVNNSRHLDPGIETLAEVYEQAGFRTGLFTCNLYLSPTFGMTRGFQDKYYLGPGFSPEEFVAHRFARHGPKPGIRDISALVNRLWFETEEYLEQKLHPHGLHAHSRDQGGQETCAVLKRWIDAVPRGTPFFAFANLMEAHLPYPQDFPPPEDGNGFIRQVNPNRWHYLLGLERQENLLNLRRLYNGGVHYLDRIVNQLLVDLEAKGVLDDTWVIITSDHGEAFGENGAVGHGIFLTEELLHVPLMISNPDQEGHTVQTPVSLIDLHNALRDLAVQPGGRFRLTPSAAIVAEDQGSALFANLVMSSVLRILKWVPGAGRAFRRAEVLGYARKVVFADGYRLEVVNENQERLFVMRNGGGWESIRDDKEVGSRLRGFLEERINETVGRVVTEGLVSTASQLYPELLPASALISIAEQVVNQALLRFRNPAILWTGGKDSTLVLWLVRRVCARRRMKIPPVMFIDHGLHFPEVLDFMKKIESEWGLTTLVARNDDFLKHARKAGEETLVAALNHDNREALRYIGFHGDSISWDLSSLEGNHILKTLPMNRLVRTRGIDALFTGIRRDENEARKGESLFSPRENPPHMRIHPILLFSERAVWEATLQNGLPVCPLYAQGYRSFDAWYDSAKTGDKPAWEQDLENSPERAGRGQDKEGIMRRLRELGYM